MVHNRSALHHPPPSEALEKDSRPKIFLWLASLQIIAVKMGYPWIAWLMIMFHVKEQPFGIMWAPVDVLEQTHIVHWRSQLPMTCRCLNMRQPQYATIPWWILNLYTCIALDKLMAKSSNKWSEQNGPIWAQKTDHVVDWNVLKHRFSRSGLLKTKDIK